MNISSYLFLCNLYLGLTGLFKDRQNSRNMAGGVKKPVNVFRLKNLGLPKEVFNWRLWFSVFSFGLLGAARGVDEGLISGAFNSKDFKKSINYASYDEVEQANIKANVSGEEFRF